MIVSNRKYPFGTKVATINAPMFTCMVSTAKEGFFEKQSTMISELPLGNIFGVKRPVAKLIYTPALSKKERLEFHDNIVMSMASMGVEMNLQNVIHSLFKSLRSSGVAAEAINLLDQDNDQICFQKSISKKSCAETLKIERDNILKECICAFESELRIIDAARLTEAELIIGAFEFVCVMAILPKCCHFGPEFDQFRDKIGVELFRGHDAVSRSRYIARYSAISKHGISSLCEALEADLKVTVTEQCEVHLVPTPGLNIVISDLIYRCFEAVGDHFEVKNVTDVFGRLP